MMGILAFLDFFNISGKIMSGSVRYLLKEKGLTYLKKSL